MKNKIMRTIGIIILGALTIAIIYLIILNLSGRSEKEESACELDIQPHLFQKLIIQADSNEMYELYIGDKYIGNFSGKQEFRYGGKGFRGGNFVFVNDLEIGPFYNKLIEVNGRDKITYAFFGCVETEIVIF